MAKKSKNLKFPVVKVKVDGKVKLFAIVKPKVDIRPGIPRKSHAGEQHHDAVPKIGIFTAAQVASDAELIAYLVSIRSGMLREIEKESDVAAAEEDVNPLADENEALKASVEELSKKLEFKEEYISKLHDKLNEPEKGYPLESGEKDAASKTAKNKGKSTTKTKGGE